MLQCFIKDLLAGNLKAVEYSSIPRAVLMTQDKTFTTEFVITWMISEVILASLGAFIFYIVHFISSEQFKRAFM